MTCNSSSTIEEAICATLEGCKGSIKISDILKKVPIKSAFNPRLRFPRSAILKSLILQKLKHFRFQTELFAYLTENDGEALSLGFYLKGGKPLIPDRRSLDHFSRHRLTEDETELIKFVVRTVEEVTAKFGILLDTIEVEPKKSKPCADRTESWRKEKKRRELCRFVRDKIYPKVDLNLGKNTTYKIGDFLDLLTHSAIKSRFANGGSKTFAMEVGKCPDGDTLLYHIKKQRNQKELQEMFKQIFEYSYQMGLKSGVISRRKPVDVAIDFTEWFFYGDKNADMVVGKKPERGTTYCYKFATINIVENGERITLMALPVKKLDNKEKIVAELVKYAEKKVNIRRLYADRGFFSIDMINKFKELKILFLMPAIRTREIKRLAETMPAPTVITDYQMGKKEHTTTFNLVILEADGHRVSFATNMEVNENEVGLCDRLLNLYGKRWGIETSYRVAKGYLAKTTSKNYEIRLFYFLYATMLYNLWILIDSIISIFLRGRITDKHLVTADIFATCLCIELHST